MDREQADSKGGVVRGWRDCTKRKRTHVHGQWCGNCKGRGIREINSNRKNTLKNWKKKKTHRLTAG